MCWRRGSFLWKAGKFFPQGQPHFRFVQFLETDETPSTQFCSFSSFWFYKAVSQSVAASFSEGRSFKSQSRCSNWDVNKGSQVMNKLPQKSAKNLKFKMQNTNQGFDTLEKRWHVCQGHKITIPDSGVSTCNQCLRRHSLITCRSPLSKNSTSLEKRALWIACEAFIINR